MEYQKFTEEESTNRKVQFRNIAIFSLSILLLVIGFLAFQQYRENTKLVADYQIERNASEAYIDQTFQTIESNLEEIRMHEGIIESNLENPEVDGSLNPEDKIQQEIEMIETIMEKNRALIASLNLKIDGQNSDLVKYKKTIAQTNKKLDSYKLEAANLMALNDSLQNNLNIVKDSYTSLESDYQVKIDEINTKSEIIDEQLTELQKIDMDLNTVFYTVGSYKELSEENLVEKEGGILGIGSTKVLANNLDQKKFVKVDKRDLTEIPIQGKKVELVTKHDIASYEIVMNNDRAEKLIINDEKAFWRDSKYLVILVKDQDDELAELKK